ncbi:MAG: PEP-CTERM sorting domain-containing protein [Desulfobacteraceae bacterium]|nr:PEP-CTERM sorting domain-containing protein [Desulfobacteraceae bacterium]
MKNFYIALTVSVLMIFGFLGTSYSYSGSYMFTMNGNESNTDEVIIETAINDWFLDNNISHDAVDLDFYSKVDAPDSTNDGLNVTYDVGNLSGTWSTANDDLIEFYSVKAANEFAFYWIEGGAISGDWSTEHLLNNGGNTPEISHLSTWNQIDGQVPNSPVPEPATMVLFGIGLIGLAGIGRKKQATK